MIEKGRLRITSLEGGSETRVWFGGHRCCYSVNLLI